jgi:hypothetical protein
MGICANGAPVWSVTTPDRLLDEVCAAATWMAAAAHAPKTAFAWRILPPVCRTVLVIAGNDRDGSPPGAPEKLP